MNILRHFINRVILDKRGFLQFLPALFSIGSAIGSATSKKPNSAMEGFELPEWWDDPKYEDAQKLLSELGSDILGGDIPDYYKGIGEPGGKEFENMLSMNLSDITKQVLEGTAMTGRGRGGLPGSLISEASAEASTQARWAEHLRALEGKQWLFGQGRGITENVRTAGANKEQRKNAFNIDVSGLDYKKRAYWDEYDAMTREWEKEKGSNIVSGALGALGSIESVVNTDGDMWDKVAAGIEGLTGGSINSKKSTTLGENEKIKIGGVSVGKDVLEKLLNELFSRGGIK